MNKQLPEVLLVFLLAILIILPGQAAWGCLGETIEIVDEEEYHQVFVVNAYWLNFTTEHGLADDYVTALAVDGTGRVYAGTRNAGLSILENFKFRTVDKRHGLPADTVTSLGISPGGDVWIGTSGGIALFSDGRINKTLTVREGLPDNLVTDISFRGNETWVATPKGIGRTTGDQWITYHLKKYLPSDKVLSVCAVPKGNVWAGAHEIIMEKVSQESWQKVFPADVPQVASAWVTDIVANGRGTWFTSVGGVLCHDETGWIHHDLGSETASNWTTAIATDSLDDLWVGTNGTGITKLSGAAVIRFNSENSRLTNENITALVIDEINHFLWIGTAGGGLFRYGLMRLEFSEEENVILEEPVSCLAHTGNDLWAGTAGNGVYRLRQFEVVQHLTTGTSLLPSNDVRDMEADRDGRLWLATWGSGVVCKDGPEWHVYTQSEHTLPSDFVSSVYCDPEDGSIWAGFADAPGPASGKVARWSDGCWVVYKKKKPPTHPGDKQLAPEEKGAPAPEERSAPGPPGKEKPAVQPGERRLPDQGILSPEAVAAMKKKGILVKEVDDSTRYSRSTVTCALRSGERWLFGSDGYGVTVFDGDFFFQMTEDDGLPSDDIVSLLRDGWGNTWFGTRWGILRRNDSGGDEYFNQTTGDENCIPGDDIRCLAIDDMNRQDLWVGLGPSSGLKEGGLARYNGYYWQRFPLGTVNDIVMDFPNLILATKRGLLLLTRR